MTLARDWTRQLYRASGAALLAPAALLAALCLVAAGGGFGALGSIGQVLSGPAVPGPHAHARGAKAAAGFAAVPPSLAISPAPAAVGSAAPGAPSGAGAASPGARPQLGGGAVGQRGSTGGSSGTGSGGTPSAGGSTGSTGGGQPGSPAPPRTPVDRIVSALTGVTERLPGPVGSGSTQALQTVGKTLDGVVPGSSHGQP